MAPEVRNQVRTWWTGALRTVDAQPDRRLSADLGTWSVMLLAIGSVVGTGVFVILGVAVPLAGPAVSISFLVAGIVCMLSGLSYAELASTLPSSGSVYSYAYASVGEGVAWIVGWCFILEYCIGLSAVSVGWSDYLVQGVQNLTGVGIPVQLSAAPAAGGFIDLPAVLVILFGAFVVSRGVRESARANNVLVMVKLGLLAFFCIVAFGAFDPANLTPLFATGIVGMLTASGQLLFAYNGFDAAAVAGGEARNPRRAIPLAIVGALAMITVVYVLVATAAVGAWPWQRFSGPDGEAALTTIVGEVTGNALVENLMSAGIVIAVVSTILAGVYTLSRVVFSISSDGLLPARLAHVSRRTRTPSTATWTLSALIAILAGFIPLATLASAVSLGTLLILTIVNACVLVLRRTQPELPRGFRVPLGPVIPIIAIAVNLYLMSRLRGTTWILFSSWVAIGIVLYLAYGQRRSTAQGGHGERGAARG